MTALGVELAERGWLPDRVLRLGIRHMLGRRLQGMDREAAGQATEYEARFANALRRRPLAEDSDAANAQHYEVPTAFFQSILGPNLKYSACLFPGKDTDLAVAEQAMLKLTCERAQLADGQRILELGCGWGSLSLWMARHYRDADITAVTNSMTQAAHVQETAEREGLRIRVVQTNVDNYDPAETFDRIVSVEMFEHVRNYEQLFRRLESWLADDGKLFVHVFSHRATPYLFEKEGSENWMGRHFFSGGTMPSHGLLPRFAGGLTTEQQWRINGMHYARTLESWLQRLDGDRSRIRELFEYTYGTDAGRWLQRWRMFLLACAELFAFKGGEEWGVSHYRFAKTT